MMGDDLRGYERQIIGHDAIIHTPYYLEGGIPLLYADYAASGRLVYYIQEIVTDDVGPMYGNTHTQANTTGGITTERYHEAWRIIKSHVGATDNDILVVEGSGMTGAVVRLQRMLDFYLPEKYKNQLTIADTDRPVVFVSEMEHHSNQTTWEETIADVEIVPLSVDSSINLDALENLIKKYRSRKTKIAAITAASNVTGVRLPVHDVAKLIHEYDGQCFVDYTCAAPYDPINMRPDDPREKLDAIYFSPHKFLGGPGTPGILIFDKDLYPENAAPYKPGGGTVNYTTPYNYRSFIKDIETREDGGTPAILGVIQASLAIRLKEDFDEKIGIAGREKEIVAQFFKELKDTPKLNILDRNRTDRLAIFSFTIDGLHDGLVARLLNDVYGIQAREGCACAGTYGHYLLKITQEASRQITDLIDIGDLSEKLGFTRVSFHPVVSNEDISFVTNAIKEIARYGSELAKDYSYDRKKNTFTHKNAHKLGALPLKNIFEVPNL